MLSGIFLGIALAAPVGPISLEMLKRGVQFGFIASLLVGIGGMSADAIFMMLIYFGTSQWLTIEFVHIGLFFFGSIFLGFLAVDSVKKIIHTPLATEQKASYPRYLYVKCYVTGLLIALINPINLLFWFGIYGSVLSETAHHSTTLQIITKACSIFFGILLWNVLIASLAKASSVVISPLLYKLIHGFAATLLIYYSIHFGLEFIHSIAS